MTTKVTRMTKEELQAELDKFVAQIEAKDAEIAALKAQKAARKAARAPKTLVKSKEAVHNADYTGFMLTLASTEEVLTAITEVQNSPWTKHPVYVKIAGHALVNGELVNYTSLVPVEVTNGGTFTLYNDGAGLAPVDDTWAKVRVVTMRPSAVERYYIGNGKAIKKNTSKMPETTVKDTESDNVEEDLTVE
jgi:hypothetical protein